MSGCGRAIEFLRDWREGLTEEHLHAWGEDCRRCTADAYDEWAALHEAMTIAGYTEHLAATEGTGE